MLTEAQQTMLLDNEADVLLNQLTSITEAVAKFDATQVPSTTTNDGDNSNETPVTTPSEGPLTDISDGSDETPATTPTENPRTETNDGSDDTPATTPREPEKMSADTCQMIREELSK